MNRRVGVLLEPGAAGRAALDEAARQAAAPGCSLWLVAVATLAPEIRCCGPSAEAINCAIRESAEGSLSAAVDRLRAEGADPHAALLVQRRDPPLAAWAQEHAIDLLLVPARRLPPHRRRHPALRARRAPVGVEVRMVRAASGFSP